MGIRERNNIHIAGSGRQPVMFAHGFGCDQSMWRFVAPFFAENYRTVLFDHVGSGRSDHSAYEDIKYSSLHGYAADILEICQELDLQDVIFVGHSVSAMMGALASIREPSRFAALVLVTPSPCYVNDGNYHGGFTRSDIDDLLHFLDSNYLGWSNAMAKVIMGNPGRPALSEELEHTFCQANPEIAKKFARVTFLSDHRADLPLIPVPTLILQCKEDTIAPLAVGEYLEQKIPLSTLVVLEAEGHCPNLSAPDELVFNIRKFLAEIRN